MMKPNLSVWFDEEMRLAMEARERGDLPSAWTALERAHVLSQSDALAHVRVHWHMLKMGRRYRGWREAIGQVPRLLLAGPASWLGRAPLGNTGGADVGMFTPLPIPEELQRKLQDR